MYSKIETGERIPDKFLLDYLLTRLDISPDILELVISIEDYNEIEIHDNIIELILLLLILTEKAENISRQMSALEEILNFCEDSSFMKPYDLFLWTRCAYYLDYELIRGERVAREMTQENLANGIYENTESISRIENGKFSPQRENYYQLMDTVGISKKTH